MIVATMLTMLLAACGSATTGDDLGGPAADINPSRLGIPDPTIQWERPIERLTYVGAGASPSAEEVELVSAVIDDIPTALLAELDVRYVVRANATTTNRPDHPSAVAYAIGPDVYLLDEAFGLSDGGSTRFDLARAVGHELVHVAQFQTLTDAYVKAAIDGDISTLNPVDGSSIVADFASETGWTNSSTDPARPAWTLDASSVAASEYGATGPGEDMAESVALVMMGLADLVPPDRVRWVERWLNAPADALALGQPWVPAGSVEVLAEQPLYDTEAVERTRGPLSRVEPAYFQLPADLPDAESFAETVEARLRTRVMAGSLERIEDVIPRYGGRFSRPDGTFWWVELWDFRARPAGTSGPDLPVLVYVATW